MKTVHIELSDKRGDIGVFEILTGAVLAAISIARHRTGITNARTFENSDVGDITKLSLVFDQEIRCWMPGSSSILF